MERGVDACCVLAHADRPADWLAGPWYPLRHVVVAVRSFVRFRSFVIVIVVVVVAVVVVVVPIAFALVLVRGACASWLVFSSLFVSVN